jgi:hypothetical protein
MTQVPPLDELLAIEAIKKLKSRRDRAVDLKDWDAYTALHAPDHLSTNDGYDPWTREVMVAHLRDGLGHVQIAHLSHTPDIVIEGDADASGIWYLEEHHVWEQGDELHWFHAFGFYHERYVKRDGAWLFHRRRVQRTMAFASEGAVHSGKDASIKAGIFRTSSGGFGAGTVPTR